MNQAARHLIGTALVVWLAGLVQDPSIRAQSTDITGHYALSPDVLSQAERNYDVIVVGGTAGGAATALQARRMGASVAIFAETNSLGGQFLTVPSIDEGWMFRNYPAGIYGELIGRINQVYAAKGVSVTGCYWDPGSRCYEPHVVNQQLTQMLTTANVDIYSRATFKNTVMDGNVVRGAQFQDATSPSRIFGSTVLVDATEYGDVIPQTGAAHYAGNGTGDSPATCIQSITYAAPIKYYDVVPANLVLPGPPPQYDSYKAEFAATVTPGYSQVGYPVSLFDHNIYRAMPDENRGLSAAAGPPKSSVNMANDYLDFYTYVKPKMPLQYFHMALDARFLTDPATRTDAIGQAKIKTLNFLYYLQDPQGLNSQHWAIADDEFAGITTPDDYSDQVPRPFKAIEALMPPFPYVRESRRLQAMTMLTANGIRRTLSADGQWRGPVWPTGIALGDYTTDFHNCNWDGTFEPWSGDKAADVGMASGPFQVPFESFIPVSVDGFLAAEKNLGLSRVANSALHLQPSVISMGQAAGAIAALSARDHVPPRRVSPLEVQMELANSGARISMYAHDDVHYPSPYWQDVQVVGARGIMVGASASHFSVADPVTRREAAAVLSRMLGYTPVGSPLPVVTRPTFDDVPASDWGLPYVEAIVAHGITAGCSSVPRKFCPNDTMTREQFAAFLVLGTGLTLGPVGGTGMFTDVDKAYAAYVEAAVGAGLMNTCGIGHFCGTGPATRAGDVAHGVVRTLSLRGGH
ncbi:MAG TPA: FAD-dependent oxidoreductase [Bryobacteraceae bacterium]|nr:FAD-dependent oxidoreductase [Bryobacteraceae bacterium]